MIRSHANAGIEAMATKPPQGDYARLDSRALAWKKLLRQAGVVLLFVLIGIKGPNVGNAHLFVGNLNGGVKTSFVEYSRPDSLTVDDAAHNNRTAKHCYLAQIDLAKIFGWYVADLKVAAWDNGLFEEKTLGSCGGFALLAKTQNMFVMANVFDDITVEIGTSRWRFANILEGKNKSTDTIGDLHNVGLPFGLNERAVSNTGGGYSDNKRQESEGEISSTYPILPSPIVTFCALVLFTVSLPGFIIGLYRQHGSFLFLFSLMSAVISGGISFAGILMWPYNH